MWVLRLMLDMCRYEGKVSRNLNIHHICCFPAQIGLTKTQMSRPRTREFVYNLLERHGVLQEAMRESQLLSSQKRLSGQTAEVVSVGGQPGKSLEHEESEKGVSLVSEGHEYTGSGHEDEAMLVASLNLSDMEAQSSPQRAAPQDQSQEPVKKYRKIQSLLRKYPYYFFCLLKLFCSK